MGIESKWNSPQSVPFGIPPKVSKTNWRAGAAKQTGMRGGAPRGAPRPPSGAFSRSRRDRLFGGTIGGSGGSFLSNSGAPCFEDLKTGTSKQGPQNSWVLVYHHPLSPAQLQSHAGKHVIRPASQAKGSALPRLKY